MPIQNKIWLGVFCAIALIASWYAVDVCWKIWNYYRLDRLIPIENVSWKVVRRSDEDYILKASFEYSLRGVSYKKEDLQASPSYKNPYVAEKALQEAISNEKNSVWVAQDSPDFVSLEKLFPWKDACYTIILFLLFIYFLWLRRFVASYNP